MFIELVGAFSCWNQFELWPSPRSTMYSFYMFDILLNHSDFLLINKHPGVSIHKDDGDTNTAARSR